MTARNWVFTLNNPQQRIDFDAPVWDGNVKFAIYMLEMGASGTPHFQGYLELRQAQRLSWLKKTPLSRAHLEKRRGTRQEAILYCMKTYQKTQQENESPQQPFAQLSIDGVTVSGNPVIYGSDESPQSLIKRCESKKLSVKDRLEEVKEMIKAGKTDQDIMESHFDLFVRYHKSFQVARRILSKPRDHEVEVIVCQGPTGTGKSRWAKETFPGAYWKQRSNWWDGYEGEEVVIIDEFYGWLPFDTLLRLCDRYPLLVETKGGQISMHCKKVVITTNAVPNAWYKNVYFNSFVRRVTEWKVFPIWGEIQSFKEYSEAIPHFVLNSD